VRVLVGCRDIGRAEAVLAGTLLWRGGVEPQVATSLPAAEAAMINHPSLVLLDRDAPWAADFIRGLRKSDTKRATSIAVYGDGEAGGVEMDLLAAGANAVLRLPVTRDWDKRLGRLLQVPPRQAVRVPVFVEVESGAVIRSTLGTTVNLSERGLLLQAPTLELGSEIQFAFRVSGAHDPVRGRGRVVRAAADGTVGVEFSEISSECLQIIRDFRKRTGF
jgi:hypothetical protein